ncbi:hypothetical protein JCM8208_006765 [Rhodotorula glutinis]
MFVVLGVDDLTLLPFVKQGEQLLDQLRQFLAAAPACFPPARHDNELVFKQFILPSGEAVSCVRWNGTFILTGTDVVRILLFRFLLINRRVHDRKKFEEGIFSDLRNLKIGEDAILEPAKLRLHSPSARTVS